MKKEIPKCKECGQEMVEIGEIRQPFDALSVFYNPQKLYQCPEDKTIELI